ncbi:MAG: extracellular solute-binding protein, partial [Phycisphaerae bacterium]|nr:extracellular solute-binding protein [Phycisphaerae bacterium]
MNPPGGIIPKALIVIAFAVILGVPWMFRPKDATAPENAERLVILTPHNEPIRYEFARAFDAWHQRTHHKPVAIDWRVPGGSSEIKKLLIAQYTAAVETGRILQTGELAPGAEPMPYDLLFGGGSFEHGELKTKGPIVKPLGSDQPVVIPISVPLAYSSEQLADWYGPGEPKIGINWLYDIGDPSKNDPGQYYLGNAVSGFGIVFNRDVLNRLGLPAPQSWTSMADPRLTGWVALADPRLSGSVATTYESILYSYGWDEGWRILRAMCANSRYFSNTSQKVPLDVSQGQAAVGTAIDFYGRFQSQSILTPGQAPEESRVGYIDPPGATLIDPDPISMLRGCPNPVIARRFIEFLMSEEGQALWNFTKAPPTSAATENHAAAEPPLGPERFELRRLPIRRIM